MENHIPVEAIPKIIAAIPPGEVLVKLTIEDTGHISVEIDPSATPTRQWVRGYVVVGVETFGRVGAECGIKTWAALQSEGVIVLRLDRFLAEHDPATDIF